MAVAAVRSKGSLEDLENDSDLNEIDYAIEDVTEAAGFDNVTDYARVLNRRPREIAELLRDNAAGRTV
jgi:hypothetical protein